MMRIIKKRKIDPKFKVIVIHTRSCTSWVYYDTSLAVYIVNSMLRTQQLPKLQTYYVIATIQQPEYDLPTTATSLWDCHVLGAWRLSTVN